MKYGDLVVVGIQDMIKGRVVKVYKKGTVMPERDALLFLEMDRDSHIFERITSVEMPGKRLIIKRHDAEGYIMAPLNLVAKA